MKATDLNQTVSKEMAELNRRSFLKGALSLGVMTSGAIVTGCTTIMGTPIPTKLAGIGHLTPQEHRVFNRLIEVLLPTEEYGLPSPVHEVPTIQNIDRMVGQLDSAMRADLNLAIRIFDYSPLLTAYSFKTASYMKSARLVKYIDNWQNGLFFQQGVMTTMKSAVYLGYWRDEKTWKHIQYDGPLTAKWGIPKLGNAPLPEWG